MSQNMKFTESDFNCFISKDKKCLKRIESKLENLVGNLSKELGCYSGIYRHKRGEFAGYLSKSKNRKSNAFFNLLMNADDLSLEFQIENKNLLLNFLKKIKVRTLNDLKKLGDCEIAAWDTDKKVCKIYPGSLGELDIKFLLNKLKKAKRPIFKLRKIYPRSEGKKFLKSPELIKDLLKSIRIMEVLHAFT